jgi:hypothetical protein
MAFHSRGSKKDGLLESHFPFVLAVSSLVNVYSYLQSGIHGMLCFCYSLLAVFSIWHHNSNGMSDESSLSSFCWKLLLSF